ncbi:MAG: glucuronate isomerase [Kiritimatiellae bacterium]|nr:glucuronate isomerase [Kiritimatiellia bacterium]
MKKFLDRDFLLDTPAAKELYHKHAAKMPIIDYHCHINPRDIAEDKRYKTITEVWLGGDHYKWRQMRTCGFPESDITGAKDSDPYRTFLAWAQTLPRLIGNPLYHWTYLELKNYFGITEPLNGRSAEKIYAKCNKKLAQKSMSVRGLISQSKVKLICTTDDPVDSLEWHDKIAADKTCKVKVLPAFRPDKAFNVDKKPFAGYIEKLEKAVGFKIARFADLRKALSARIEFFASKGCKVSDHGLDYAVFAEATEKELDRILAAGRKGAKIDVETGDKFRTAVLKHLAGEYAKHGWVMQLHYGCIRDNSDRMMAALGPDTGFDAVGDTRGAKALANLLNSFEQTGSMPKVILYSLNQNDNEIMGTLAGCFQTDGSFPQRVQVGSAWWFNDHRLGMEKQLRDLANLSCLAGFVGMLTDSRSFLSYARHEYFRRILCRVIGRWVEDGEVVADMEFLGKVVEDISFNNANRYFGFGL